MLLRRSSAIRVARESLRATAVPPSFWHGSGAPFMGPATITLGREVISSLGHPRGYPRFSGGGKGPPAGSIEVSPCRPGGSGVGLCLPG
jgi:hypothetical protein